jgi:hypothetical protein
VDSPRPALESPSWKKRAEDSAAKLLGVCAMVPKSSSAQLLISTIKNLLADN